MSVPADIAEEIEEALSSELGRSVRLGGSRAVGGGCISPAARVEIEGEEPAFLKWSEPGVVPTDFFHEEAKSLRALATAAAVRVPAVRAVAERWLLLEWLEPGRASADTWARLGSALALQHRTRAAAFGWAADNYIGSLRQSNGWHEEWPAFWRDQRLEPQLARAMKHGHFGRAECARFHALLARLEEALVVASTEGPSLLHGDLWGGNVHTLRDGTPALVDPSSYHGHREVDLAMAELFGGFAKNFFHAYEEAWALAAGYCELRRPIYQLYYLLVHVNLFGAAYVRGSMAAVDAALGALRQEG